MDTVLLIPAYQPTEALLQVLTSLQNDALHLLVVNDGSGEEYEDIFTKAAELATVISHTPNRGKGFAIKHGIYYVKEYLPECRYIVTADADGQHKPQDVLKISECLHEKSGFVIGARKFDGHVPLRSRLGNAITKFVFMIAAGKKCSDTQTGLRGFSSDLFDYMLNVKGDRFEYEMNVLMHTAQEGIAIREVPIATVYEKTGHKSHFRTVVDSFRVYKTIILNSHFIKYGLSAVASFIIDFTMLLLFNKLYGNVIPPDWILTSSVMATITARLISSPINYLINRMWVFKSDANKAASFISFAFLAACVLAAKSGLIYLLVDVLHQPIALANISVEILLFISNFLIQKLFIFKKKKK